MSNKNSTPPQFEYPALLQKQLKFENVQVVKTEKNKSNDDMSPKQSDNDTPRITIQSAHNMEVENSVETKNLNPGRV